MKKVILVGFMGSGKSTIGQKLSKELKLPFFEMDLEIEKKAEKSIPTIFEEDGEKVFRQLETEMLKNIIQQDGVIATGGGTVTQKENVDILSNEDIVVYLKGQIDHLMTNIANDTKNKRPLADLKKKDDLSRLLNKRNPHYQIVADIILSIDGKEIDEIVEEIVIKIKGMGS